MFYLKYHLYRNYFPLYALARYRNVRERESRSSAGCRCGPRNSTEQNAQESE